MNQLEKVSKVVALLIERTKSKNMPWGESTKGSILARVGDSYVGLSRGDDEWEEPFFTLMLYNTDGKIVETYTDRSLSELPPPNGFNDYYSALASLYNEGLSAAKGIDDTLDSLISNLSGA